MNFSETFIKRPIATSLMMAAIALFGLVAYRSLPVSDLPNVDFPTLLVTASLPGASPDTMASAVATPLENQFSNISGLDSMTSTNSLGSTQVTLEFVLNKSLDGAAVDVQSAITQAARLLPAGMPTPPTFTKVNPADQPILYLAITSQTLPLWTLDEYAETRIAQRISMVSGVAQVQVLGAQKYAVHAQLDPHLLASRQIGINEVQTALSGWNVNLPTGSIIGPQRAFTLQATGQLMSAAQYRPLIVAYRNGSPVRLEELGSVIDSVEDDKTASWFYTKQGSQRAIVLGVQRQPGTNTIAVTDAVKNLLPTFRSEIPASVKMDILYDRSDTIRESYKDVLSTMFLTLALVVMVIFLFLRNVSATVIPSLALPFSIIGTFAIMYLLHYSLDNLSMMALILSIGFVVDDAIVMLENIFRHMEMGEKPLYAALTGSKEIGFTIVSMTLSLAAVFIPVLFLGGILGRLFREFAVTICVAILISGIVSVTLTPMLCSRFLRSPEEQKRSWFYRITERFFEALLRVYDRTLQVVLRHRAVTMLASLLVLAGTVVMFIKIPKGFIPDQDTDQIYAVTEAAQGTSYYQMVDYQKRVAEVFRTNPNVQALMSTVGGTSASTLGRPQLRRAGGSSEAALGAQGTGQRNHRGSAAETLANFPGMRVYVQNPPTIRIGGQVTKSLYQFSMQSPDKAELYKGAERLEHEIKKLPEVEDVTSDLAVVAPQVNVNIDRDKAAALQVNADAIENAFYDAYGPRWVSTIYAAINEYKVLLELKPQYQADPHALSLLYFKSSNGPLIPLDTLAKLQQDIGPQTINHYGQLNAVTVSFNLKPGAALGDVVSKVQDLASQTLPSGITTDFQGAAKAFENSLGNLWVLSDRRHPGCLYRARNSLRELHPSAHDSLRPALGRLRRSAYSLPVPHGLEHLRFRRPDHADRHRREERDHADRLRIWRPSATKASSPMKAIYEGCLIRFRPIMMTTMAALLGAVPIALGYGAGGEARQPLGLVVVVGGLLFSQLVTLYFTPVFYTYMAALLERIQRHKQRAKQALPEPTIA